MKKLIMNINRKYLTRFIVIVVLCVAFFLAACSKENLSDDSISFSCGSNLEIAIGMKKTDIEEICDQRFENDKYYELYDQHCCVGFIKDKLAYVEYDKNWIISKGPQMNDKCENLITFFGEPLYEESFVEPTEKITKYIKLDYVFSNIRYSYYGDFPDYEHIYGVICTDTRVDTSIIQLDKENYIQRTIDEWFSLIPLVAYHGYDPMIDTIGNITLSIGTAKNVYEDKFGRSFENGIYYKLEPHCVLYFEDDKLTVYGFGKGWAITEGDPSVNLYGKYMPEAMEKISDLISCKMHTNSNYHSELVFELKNEQRICYHSIVEDGKINFVYIIDANSEIDTIPFEL